MLLLDSLFNSLELFKSTTLLILFDLTLLLLTISFPNFFVGKFLITSEISLFSKSYNSFLTSVKLIPIRDCFTFFSICSNVNIFISFLEFFTGFMLLFVFFFK